MSHVAEQYPEVIRPKAKGAKLQNLNAVKSLQYCQDIESRADGRTELGKGLQFHKRRLLELFGCEFSQLDPIEAERVRRLVALRVVRELAQARVQLSITAADSEAFALAEQRLVAICVTEERAELRLLESLNLRRQSKPKQSLHDRLALKIVSIPRPPSAWAGGATSSGTADVKPEPFQFAVPDQDAEARPVAVLVEPPVEPVVETPIISDWCCIFCGTKVYAVPKPERCRRCKTSRFRELSGGPPNAA